MKNLDYKWAFWIILVFSTIRFDLPMAIRMPISELLAFGSLPFLINSVDFSPYLPRLKVVIGLLVLWLLGSVISDFANANLFQRALRGFSKPIFVFLWTLFFVIILQKDYRLLLFGVLGEFLSSIQNYLLPQSFTAEYISAGGYEAAAFGLTPIIEASFMCAAAWFYIKYKLFSATSYFLMALVFALIGAPRSQMAMALMSSFMIGYLWWTLSGRRGIQLSFSRLAILALLSAVALYGIYELYVVLAQNGTLGEYHQEKLKMQSKTIFGDSPLGLLLGGRPQFFGALVALMDYPLLGSGSWTAVFMTDYFYEAMVMVGTDDSIDKTMERGALVGVGHSIVLQAWLENGFLALISLLGILWISTKVFLKTLRYDNFLTPIILSSFLAIFWSFWFSPFDTNARQVFGMFLAFYIFDYPQTWRCNTLSPVRKFSHFSNRVRPKVVSN